MKQINFRADQVTQVLLNSIAEKTDSKQSEVLKKAIFIYAEQILNRKELSDILIETYRN